MAAPPLFDFFTYASSIATLIRDEFSALEEVSFPPTAEGFTESRFSDVKIPAFLMNFEDPEVASRTDLDFEMNRLGEDVEDDDEYFMPMTLRLAGYLLMPVFAVANAQVPHVNPTVLLAQAASNLAAKIYSGARGWNCGVARITQIRFIDDSTTDQERNYHVAEIHWEHDVWVGATPTSTSVLADTVFNRFAFPTEDDLPDDSTEVYPDRGEPEP